MNQNRSLLTAALAVALLGSHAFAADKESGGRVRRRTGGTTPSGSATPSTGDKKDGAPATSASTPPPARSFGTAPAGWDQCKWSDPEHQTPKYVVGRIVAPFPHTPNGLRQAAPLVAQYYPGTKWVEKGAGDKIDIPCVGVIDMVVAADGPDVGKSWAWQVVEDKCNKCPDGKDHCNGPQVKKSKKCGSGLGEALGPISGGGNRPPAPAPAPGGGAPPAGGGHARPPCIPPNAKKVAEAVLGREGMHQALKRLCRNGTDWTYLDAVVDELRERDERWGYWCRRGNCNDPSHDVLAFYCGSGSPVEGSSNAAGVDFVIASCYNPEDAEKENPSIGWGEVFGNQGKPAWTSRGRF